MKKYLLTFCLFLCGLWGGAQSLLPAPQHVRMHEGAFDWSRGYRLRYADKALKNSGWAQPVSEWAARASATRSDKHRVLLLNTWQEAPSPEAYSLHVTSDSVIVRAASRQGFTYAVATLQQLTKAGKTVCCDVTDFPAYRWRGAMLDVSRHFFSLDFLKKQIDILSAYKFNRLHLHLTDAAGWRMEIKRYPRLTELAAWRTDSLWKTWWNGGRKYVEEGTPGAYGGYYTQQELRELVDYAAQRGITVVPEIEMPAHSEEVLTAYPELSCTHEPYKQADFCPGNEATYAFLENVLTEVMEVFPSYYIHVGGDEAAKASWPDCPLCRQRMAEEGMTDVNGLQSYLIRRMAAFLRQKGRCLLGWDEIIDGNLGEETTVMVWRNPEKGREAADHGYDVIMAPGKYCYLDGYQDAPSTQPEAIGGYTPLRTVYDFCPAADMTPAQRSHLLGVQGNLWTEYIPTPEHVEYMLYPRLLALAEIGWTGEERKDYEDFYRRALHETNRLRATGVNAFDLSHEVGNRPEYTEPLRHQAVGAAVTYHHPYSPYYSGSGDSTLTDGRGGGWNYGDGRWLGFIGKDYALDLTLDLGTAREVTEIATDFYQSGGAWIYFPTEFLIEVSEDGENFHTVYTHGVPVEKDARSATEWWTWRGREQARYIRLRGKCGLEGGWIFIDEVMVR